MSRTITSSQISFIDTTDNRKLDLSIASNMPQVQIKNSNTGAFSPDWTVNNLVLQATTYLDSQDISTSATYIWYRKYGTGTETQIATNKNITINANLTDVSGIVTYRCVASYQGLSATEQLVFTRNDSGINGNPGTPAAQVQAQYSSNGTTWSSVLQGDSQYIRFSYDGGSTWTTSIKIKGQDGTGVAIKGTAYTTETTLSAGMTITTLYSDSAKTTAINKNNLVEGDSYIVNGYLCVFDDSADNFICTGVIQGPKGDQGNSSYTFIRYATSSAGANMSSSPSGKTYIGIAVTSTNSAPTSASSYTWSKYVGEDAKSITLSANSQIFKVDKNSVASPATITVVGIPINTTISTWQYSTDGGANFVSTIPTGVVRNGNQVTVTGASITSNSITIRATDGTYFDTLTVFKVLDGGDGDPGNPGAPASLAFLTNEHINFVANSSGQVASQTITTNVVAYTGTTKVTPVLGTITGLPTGMTITAANITTASNEKVIPIVIAANATFGSTGSNSGTINIPITSPVSTNLKLNWSKVNTGAQGNTGVGISAITEYYAVSSSNTTAPTTWQATPPTMTTTNKYLWNYETITYTNNTTHDTEKRVIGAYGNTGSGGNDAYTVVLSNESHTFPGDVNNALAGNTTTSIIAYKGATRQSVTIGTITGQVTGLTTAISNNNTQDASITITAATTLTTKNGILSIPITVDGKSFTKSFSWSVAFKGATGGTGSQGNPGTPASVVHINPSALFFKSTTGEQGPFTPEYIYLYPSFQTVSFSKWQYSTNGGSTWVDAAGANGLTIGTYNSIGNTLRIARTSTLYTSSVTSVSFKCISSTASVYDTVSITKIYDVVDLKIGGRNLAIDTNSQNWTSWSSANLTFSDGIRTKIIKATCNTEDTATSGQFGVQQLNTNKIIRLIENNIYTLSFLVRGNVPNLNYIYIMNSGGSNQSIGGIKVLSETNFNKVSITFNASKVTGDSTGSNLMISYIGARNKSMWFEIAEVQLELGNVSTDWSPSFEDINAQINTESGIVAMLSNEAHFFVANASGVPTATSTVLDVVGYKGSVQQNTTVGTITGLPGAGMTATISNNGTQNTKITVAVTTALTSAIADSGVLNIPITIAGKTINKLFSWSKSKDGVAAKLINLSASGQVFKVAANGTVTPATLTVSSETQNTTASTWTYSVNGAAFSTTVPTGVSRSGNTVTITGSTMTANSITVKASDGTSSDVMTVVKVSDGATGNGISSIVNYYLATDSSTGVTISTSGWTTTIQTTTASKRYLWNYEVINYTNGTKNTSATRIMGTHGTNAISFTIYAPNGYLLSPNLASLTLQTFAYDGATAITSGATYKWYKWVDNAWSVISGATNSSINVTRSDVLNSQTYKCEMTYKSVVYSSTETVEDKSDTYEAMLCTTSYDVISDTNKFIIAYVLTYNQNGEADALLGPISKVAPSSPVSGSYWYAIDEAAETVTLKKYNGTAWANSTDTQLFTYQWSLSGTGKVRVIKKSDINIVTDVQCEVVDSDLGVIARCNQLFYDNHDPIVSATEPTVKSDGQIWLKRYDNGTFSIYTWDAANNTWIINETDTRQKIFTTKPSNYRAGDIWIIDKNYIPTGFEIGTMLKAQNSNTNYADSDWVDATLYGEQLGKLKEKVDQYDNYFNFSFDKGLEMRGLDANGNPSKFTTRLGYNELGFYQDNDRVAYINNHKMNITEAEISKVSTPLLNIGNFSFITESNGSMSIIYNG